MIASGIQSDGWKVEVTDLRDAENAGTITVTSYDSETQQPVTEEQDVEGKVVSGILFKPDTATAENPAPAVVFTHGYLNNREMQLQNAIELARRGFVVLAVDREGHGNYEYGANTTSGALMATSGLYDSAKYLYNLDYVDKDKIGISGHSMGGFTTAMTLLQDASVGIVSAGLIQSWDTFMGAGSDVSVGFLKSVDDEFFYTTNENGGTISREWLSTETAKDYVGIAGSEGDVVNGGIYVNGVLTEVAGGEAAPGAFRAIYEVPGIHPQVHYSVDGAEAVINFFYTAFGTPSGHDYIEESNQTWWVKEMFSFIGMIALFACIFRWSACCSPPPSSALLRRRRRRRLSLPRPLRRLRPTPRLRHRSHATPRRQRFLPLPHPSQPPSSPPSTSRNPSKAFGRTSPIGWVLLP